MKVFLFVCVFFMMVINGFSASDEELRHMIDSQPSGYKKIMRADAEQNVQAQGCHPGYICLWCMAGVLVGGVAGVMCGACVGSVWKIGLAGTGAGGCGGGFVRAVYEGYRACTSHDISSEKTHILVRVAPKSSS